MRLISQYLLFGVCLYATIALLRISSYKDADIKSILKSLLFSVFMWPLALLIFLFGDDKEK